MAVCTNYFQEFKLDNGVAHNLLQYADDTILIGNGSWSNLWSMKSILVSFELILGLKINIRNSSLFGIMTDDYFMKAAEHFIGCRLDGLSFKFLSLTVGGNHRRIFFWDPVVKCLKTKLSSWKGRWLSTGGRIALINLVLFNLPVYFLSFYTLPKKFLHVLVSLRRKFLWAWLKGKSYIAWVSWKTICKSKEEGGLGVKDLGMFNKALLEKWWW
ncbi:unnamed protein product [Lathyrus sativus]|nr:unnamed protein product [Lathyrus sativus]